MGKDNNPGRGGRGNNPQQGGRGGRGKGKHESKHNKPQYKQEELKFSPYGQAYGKHSATFDTVLEFIVNTIQKTYKHGQDIGESLLNMEKVDLSDQEPVMGEVEPPGDTAIAGGAAAVTMRARQQLKSLEVKYSIDYQKYSDRLDILKENMLKAYSLIYGNYCTQGMQSRLQQLPNFTTEIRGDPIELLKTIQILMHDPVRGRYPYATVCDVWRTLFFTKQGENENILDYSKRFKQSRDVVKTYMGDEMFHKFVERTPEYRNEEDEDV